MGLAIAVQHLLHADAIAATEQIPILDGAGVERGVDDAGRHG
jgi:hypothetical protein